MIMGCTFNIHNKYLMVIRLIEGSQNINKVSNNKQIIMKNATQLY